MQEDVEVEAGDVVTDDDVRIKFADLGQQERQERPLRLHFVNLEVKCKIERILNLEMSGTDGI